MKTKTKVIQGLAKAAVVASIAASAYYLYASKDADKHRKKVGTWVIKARREIAREIKLLSAGRFNEKNYRAIVQKAAERYQRLQDLTKTEAVEFTKTLMSEWKKINSAKPSVRPRSKKVQ